MRIELTEQSVVWDIRPFIEGRLKSSSSTRRVENINPATELPLCMIPSGSVDDVNAAVEVARRRFIDRAWAAKPTHGRAEILRKLADLIVRDHAEIALLDTLEMGKPIAASIYDAKEFAPRMLRSCADVMDGLLGSSAPLRSGEMAFNSYVPRGVVAAIVPWNFPCVNAVIKLAPALAAGNSVVLKPSEVSPSSALKLARLAIEAGLPEGVFNVVPGLGSTVGAALASHIDVDLISFTGSTTTGRRVMELAGRSNGKPVLLECGGKSAQVVFEDVLDIEYVASSSVSSFLRNQGQVCSAHTRLIVHEKVKSELLERVVALARDYVPKHPLDESAVFGPLATPAQRDRVKDFIELGLRDGAYPILRGEVRERGGCFVAPTVFDRVGQTSRLIQEEIFGPVLCVQTFRTEEEAVALANGTAFGLAATIWTRDLGRGIRMAHSIRAGSVSIRTAGAEPTDSGAMLSCEPQKASGFGCEVGVKGLESYSTLKLVSYSGA